MTATTPLLSAKMRDFLDKVKRFAARARLKAERLE
jgi:hypothetical protein